MPCHHCPCDNFKFSCKHKKVVDPVTGCVVSSQGVLDARDSFNVMIYDVSPQSGFTFEFPVPDGRDPVAESVKWQQWTPEAIQSQKATINATVESLRNAPQSLQGLWESERQTLDNLGKDLFIWLVDPVRMLWTNGTSFQPFFDTMGTYFWINTSLFGLNFYAALLGLDASTQAINNYVESLEQYTEYQRNGLKEDIVYSLNDTQFLAFGTYPLSVEGNTPPEETTTLALYFQFGTPEQIAAGVEALEKARAATAKHIEFLTTEYLPKATLLRGPEHPGLGAPGLPRAGAVAQYSFAREFIPNTFLSAETIFQLGVEQQNQIQEEMVQVSNEFILDEPVADWDEFITKFRTEPSFSQNFLTQVTVEQNIRETESIIFESWAACTKAFKRLPRPPTDVVPFAGFGAASANTASSELDGTGTVIATRDDGTRNSIYNFPSLSNTDPIDPNEVITTFKSFDSSTAYHEAIPGHTFQLGLQGFLACPIAFPFNSGPAEGWALYAEKVAANDMGLAIPGVSRNGAQRRISFLSSRLFRAVRLVVDTGLHDRGMSRQEVVDYMLANTVELEGFIQTEVDRYTAWPAQALGYLLGALVIDEERERAEKALGDLFDLTEYNDLLIRWEAPNEDTIQKQTDYYICRKLAGNFDQSEGGDWPAIVQQGDRRIFPAIQGCDTSSRKSNHIGVGTLEAFATGIEGAEDKKDKAARILRDIRNSLHSGGLSQPLKAKTAQAIAKAQTN